MQSVLEVPPALAQPTADLIGAALLRLAAIARQRADRLLEPPLGLLARALRSLLASASGHVGLLDQALALGRSSARHAQSWFAPVQTAATRSTQGDGRSDKRERSAFGQRKSGPSPAIADRVDSLPSTNSPSARPGRMGRGILSMALAETQQLRMLERLRSAGQQPVTLDQCAQAESTSPPSSSASSNSTGM